MLATNLLAKNILVQVDKHGHKYQMLEEISEDQKSEEAIKENNTWYTTCTGTQRCRYITKR